MGINPRSVDPPKVSVWLSHFKWCHLIDSPLAVQIVLASLNQEDLELVVEVGKSTSDDTTTRTTTNHNNINFVWDSHLG